MNGHTESGYSIVDIKSLRESANNPRQHFDGQALRDLADSMKDKGILSPLLVRPIEDTFEILDGARRYRAAKLAEITELPVIIRTLNDQQALEITVISNIQREDLHPIEEATGYKTLIDHLKFDPATIAERIGKSVVYVYQRLQLLKLIPAARKSFLEGEIQLAHAQLIMRLQAPDQAKALDSLYDKEYGSRTKHIQPASKLHEWIKKNCFLDLNAAPWKKDVPLAGAVPCNTCIRRSGCSPSLFPDLTNKDICTDPACFAEKMKESIKTKEKEIADAGQKAVRISTEWHSDDVLRKLRAIGSNSYSIVPKNKKKCPTTVRGIVVDGKGVGQVHDICTNVQCKVHRNRNYCSSRPEPVKRTPQAIAAEKLMKVKEAATERAHRAACQLIADKAMKDFSIVDLRAIFHDMMENMPSEIAEETAISRTWMKPPEDKRRNYMQSYGVAEKILTQHANDMDQRNLLALMLQIALLQDYPSGWRSVGPFQAAVKRYGINWKDLMTRAMEAEAAVANAAKTAEATKKVKAETAKQSAAAINARKVTGKVK